MKIAFWNINMGTTSTIGKSTAFSSWCAAVKPDLLLLEEVSATLTTDPAVLNAATGMQIVNYVNTLDKNLQPSTKQLVALGATGNPLGFAATALRLPGLTSIRASIKVTASRQPDIYGIHANASMSGGRAAIEKAAGLSGGSGATVLIGGDFNGSMPTDKSAVASNRFDGVALPFTQWAAGKGNSSETKRLFGLTTTQLTTNPQPSPNGVIDFVMPGSHVKVVPLNNCPDEKTWAGIAGQFDHAPIVYDVTLV